jgi:hypothetical protein
MSSGFARRPRKEVVSLRPLWKLLEQKRPDALTRAKRWLWQLAEKNKSRVMVWRRTPQNPWQHLFSSIRRRSASTNSHLAIARVLIQIEGLPAALHQPIDQGSTFLHCLIHMCHWPGETDALVAWCLTYSWFETADELSHFCTSFLPESMKTETLAKNDRRGAAIRFTLHHLIPVPPVALIVFAHLDHFFL